MHIHQILLHPLLVHIQQILHEKEVGGQGKEREGFECVAVFTVISVFTVAVLSIEKCLYVVVD